MSVGLSSKTRVEADQELDFRNEIIRQIQGEQRWGRKWEFKKFWQRRVEAAEMNQHEQVSKATAQHQGQGQCPPRIGRERRGEQTSRQCENKGAAVEQNGDNAIFPSQATQQERQCQGGKHR